MLKNIACLDPKPDNLYYPPARGDYVYFEGPAFQPASGFHFANASWAADASMFSYARYGQQRSNDAEFKGVLRNAGFPIAETIGDCFVDNASTARGFFAGNDEFAILAFRGTEKDNLRDAGADLELSPDFKDLLHGTFIHAGFQRYFDSVSVNVASLIREYRKDHRTQEICITGHSLGAALATLAFRQLADPISSLYTFGCPRVGNHTFCSELTKAGNRQGIYRFVDNEDVVTHVPTGPVYVDPACAVLWIDGDRHTVREATSLPGDPKDFLDLARGFFTGTMLDAKLPGPLADHSPVRYCHWISQRANAA